MHKTDLSSCKNGRRDIQDTWTISRGAPVGETGRNWELLFDGFLVDTGVHLGCNLIGRLPGVVMEDQPGLVGGGGVEFKGGSQLWLRLK